MQSCANRIRAALLVGRGIGCIEMISDIATGRARVATGVEDTIHFEWARALAPGFGLVLVLRQIFSDFPVSAWLRQFLSRLVMAITVGYHQGGSNTDVALIILMASIM